MASRLQASLSLSLRLVGSRFPLARCVGDRHASQQDRRRRMVGPGRDEEEGRFQLVPEPLSP